MNPRRTCESCGKPTEPHQSVSLGSMDEGYRHLCLACYNASIAEYAGIDFEHVDFEPLTLSDAVGNEHEFRFGLRLCGDRVVLDAHENTADGSLGYEFQVIGYDPLGEPLELFRRLLEKMRRALSMCHLRETELGLLGIGDEGVVRATISCDLNSDSSERVPLLVVDGREVTWEEFGRMLMTYEGWQFRMEVFDKSAER